MVTDIEGVRVGHWTDHRARTGCTVVLLPEGTVGSGEVRGGAPATREFELLDPQRRVDRLDAVVLSGGSAFGLAAADGVMRHLEAEGVGFPTPSGPVPIVVAMSLFDLMVGDAAVRPGAEQGLEAARSAVGGPVAVGRIGAGAGCTVSKLWGPDRVEDGGLGTARLGLGPLVVAALIAVNASGRIDDGRPVDQTEVARAMADAYGGSAFPVAAPADASGEPSGPAPGGAPNTTIGVVVTNARLDKVGCHVVAQGAHSGLARALVPSHTRLDGDAVVVAATGEADAHVDVVRHLAMAATEAAIRSVGSASP